MEKERGIKILAVVALLVSVIGLSIAYAAYSATLLVSGTVTAKKSADAWNIRFSSTDGTSTSGTTIATLPEGFRPTSSPILIGTTEEGYGKNMKVQYFCIQPDGQVVIFAQKALRQIKLSASFILD